MRKRQSAIHVRRSAHPKSRLPVVSHHWPRGVERDGQSERPIVITGGAGFIGTNLAHRLLSAKRRVWLFDNLSRPGVERNLERLRNLYGDRVRHEPGDVRDFQAVRQVVSQASRIFHFAAQVAVTTSLDNPTADFEINARGTLNVLEALRAMDHPPPLVFTSTNKVYGNLGDVKLRINRDRYEPVEERILQQGFSESQPTDFHSPYGCSKGSADHYVLDYARTFGLPAAVFRMSCIYGPHQMGNEDQGWVAHFLIQAIENSPITLYGDGRQVRDILFVEDLVEALLLAQRHMDKLAGRVFNIGGGPANTTSLLELVKIIGKLHGRRPAVRFADWRAADQRYYVADTRKFNAATGWAPEVGVRSGVERLYGWLQNFHRPIHAALAQPKETVDRRNGKAMRVSPAMVPAK